MKRCSYCGKEYPDDVTVCAVDGESLGGWKGERKSVAGVWRGIYGCGERKATPETGSVAFTLKLKQGWMGHFNGSVTEDTPQGIAGTGAVDGYFGSAKIEFTKQMPVGYITGSDGTRKTLREYVVAEGHRCDHDLPSPPIFYQGIFLDMNRVQGIWTIEPRPIPLPGGLSYSPSRTSGFWCAEFVTDDMNADPTGGPRAPLFDKGRLSPQELEDVEGPVLRSMGKFRVADAENFMKRLDQENIRFEIDRDDTAMRQLTPGMTYFGNAKMIEIFVRAEDMVQAVAIIHSDDKV
jgi:hypothetical protein